MAQNDGYLWHVVSSYGVEIDIPTNLIQAETGLITDRLMMIIGDGTPNPPRIVTDKSNGIFSLATLDELELPGGLTVVKSRPGAIGTITPSRMTTTKGLLAYRGSDQFGQDLWGAVSVTSNDKTLLVANGDGSAGIDLKVNPDSAVLANIVKSIVGNIYFHRGIASGNGNTISLVIDPGLPPDPATHVVLFYPNASSSDASTINGIPLTRNDGSATQAGDIVAGDPTLVVFQGGNSNKCSLLSLSYNELQDDLDALHTTIDGEINALHNTLEGELSALNTSLTNKINTAASGAAAAAIASIYFHRGQDSGNVNALNLSIDPPLPSDPTGHTVFTVPRFSNTGPTTINGASLTRLDGTPLQSKDLIAGMPVQITFLSGNVACLAHLCYNEVLRLANNQTVWVRPDGNDANDGSANTPDKAFATIGGAVIVGSNKFSFASSSLNIKLGLASTTPYILPFIVPAVPGTINILGDPTNVGGFIVQESPAAQGDMLISSAQALNISGVKVNNPGNGFGGFVAGAGNLSVDHIVFANRGSGKVGNCVQANPNGNVSVGDGTVLSGAHGVPFFNNGGTLGMGNNPGAANVNITLLAGFSADVMFQLGINAQTTLLSALAFSGTNAGAQWSIDTFAVLNTSGRTGNFIPGDSTKNVLSADGRVR